MDICYYNSQIKEELDGAADYIKRAIACKEKHSDWASLYAQMSDMELGHAKNLLAIYDDDLKDFKMEVKDDLFKSYLDSESEIIHNMYTENVAKIKYMHDTYNNK